MLSHPYSPHAKVYKQMATGIWEKLNSGGDQQRPAPRIVMRQLLRRPPQLLH